MSITVQSRIHRTMGRLKHFRSCSRWDDLSQLRGLRSPLKSDENLCGVYENVPGSAGDLLVFTDIGMHIWQGSGWRSLNYVDIATTEWPPDPKAEARTLTVRMKTGAVERLTILGGAESGGGLFDVMRFIDRVVADSTRKERS